MRRAVRGPQGQRLTAERGDGPGQGPASAAEPAAAAATGNADAGSPKPAKSAPADGAAVTTGAQAAHGHVEIDPRRDGHTGGGGPGRRAEGRHDRHVLSDRQR